MICFNKGNNSEDNYNEMEAAAQKNNIKVSVVGSLRQDWHKELMDIPLKKFKDSKSEYSANAVLLKEMLESIQLVLVLEDLTVSRKAVNKFTMPAQQHLFTIFN